MRKTFRKRERACARLEGLILRRRAAPSRRMRTSQRMRPHASRRIAARHGGRKDLRARRAAMLLSMRARNAFWRNEPNRDFGSRLSLRSAGRWVLRSWREAPTCGCRTASPARLLCFAPVLYREPCNSNVSSRNGGHFRQTSPTAFWPNEPNRILTKAEPGAILDSLAPRP